MPAPTPTSFAQKIVKRILKSQTQYDFDGSFDFIVRVRRLDSTMTVITTLTIDKFPDTVTSDADLIPASDHCFFRANDTTSSIIINDADTPAETSGITYLECVFVNTFCRATVDSDANISALKFIDKNASDGIRVMRVERPDIDTVQGCIDAATALRDEFEKIPVTVTDVQTRQSGYESGQTMQYTSPVDGKIFIVTISEVVRSWSAGWLYTLTLQYVVLKSIEQRQKEALRAIRLQPTSRKTKIDTTYVIA